MGFCSLVSFWRGTQRHQSHHDEVSMNLRACGIRKASVFFSVKLQWQPGVPPSNKPTSHGPTLPFLILFGCLQILKRWKFYSILKLSITFSQCSKTTFTIVSSSRGSLKLKRLLWIFPSLVIPLYESQAHLYLDPLGVIPTHSTQGYESFFFKLCTVIHLSLSKTADKPADILPGFAQSPLQPPREQCHNKLCWF